MVEMIAFNSPETVVVASENDLRKQRPLKKKTSTLNTIFFYLGIEQRSGEDANLCYRMLILAALFVVFFISAFGFFVMWFTEMYNNSLLEKLTLTPNSTAAEWWATPPVFPLLKVHVFNYTNAEEYFAGEDIKLRVEELGPYVYKETAEKINVIHNADGTISYREHRHIQFLPGESSGNPFDHVIVPNVVFLTAETKMKNENSLTKLSYNIMKGATSSTAFMKQPVESFLWGYEDKLLNMIKTVTMFSNDIQMSRFGMLMTRNGTSAENFTIYSGESSLQHLALIKELDGNVRLNQWHTDECDLVGGTDGSQFPPHLMDRYQHLQVFIKSLCRKFPLVYDSEVTALDGIPAWRYKIPKTVFLHPREHAPNQCYCMDESSNCAPSGVFNITGCSLGAPIFASFPHFYTGDQELIHAIEGLEPVQEKHETYADIHPRLAFPIGGASRFQINIRVQKGLDKFAEELYLPIIWLEVVPGEISDELRAMIYHSTYSANAIQMSLRIGSLVIFVLSFVLIAAKCYCGRRKSENINGFTGRSGQFAAY
ncbi:lysosome membrane protein 2-like isoform X1 [Anopheles bellator]|uniref:lysosome membrane protein 2-like isoform X1 n=1 Tax=Anopheles bellator TaxID=139047 RepID=UPI00264927FC|nr:lysosome membrane protein 2-like isoform X1 [Anopheles bellator]